MKNNRKKLLINPNFQLRVIGIIGIFTIIVIAVMFLMNYMFIVDYMNLGEKLGLEKTHIYFTFILKQKSSLLIYTVISMIASLIMLLIAGLLITHKIAGPIKRFENYFLNLSKGMDTQEVHVRKNDYFLELFDAYNKSIKK